MEIAPPPTAGFTTIARVDRSLVRSSRRMAATDISLHVGVACLIAAIIVGAVAMSPLWPPRVLDDSAMSTPN